MQPAFPTTEAFPAVITTNQKFSRRAMGYLWENRSEFDPVTVGLLDSLYKNRKKGELFCIQPITYKRKAHGYGRYYGNKSSLEFLQNECRATLCRDYYHDIDIVNAQPVLLAQLGEKIGYDLPRLDFYVEHREAVLADVMDNLSISRDDAKTEVLKVCYGGKCEALCELYDELRGFCKKLMNHSTQMAGLWAIAEKKAKAEDKSKYGCFLSLVAQTLECWCMLAMKEAFESRGWSVDVLVFDGIMVAKREGQTITPELFQAVQQHIADVTGYKVSVLEKPMVGFTMPPVDDRTEVVPGVKMDEYNEMKTLFERNHFYHSATNQFVEVNEETGDLLMMDTAHASEYLRSWIFKTSNNNLKNTQFFPIWRDDCTRRVIHRIDMKPSTDPCVYSPPTRFAFNAVDAPDNAAEYIATFQDLVSKVIPDDVMRELFMEWLAQLVQKPFDSSKTCIVLAGGKGCGKDTIGDWISEYLLGRTLSHNYESNDQFWEKHDVGRLNRLFVKLEEASGVLNKKHEDDFKGRITSDTLTVNPKGQKPVTTGNYVRYFLTTNHGCPIALDEGERRFAVIHCGSELIGKMDYWNALRGNGCAPKLFCKEAAKAIGDWLMTLTTGSFPRVLPRSALAQDIIDATKSAEERFVFSDAWDGQAVSAQELFVMYRMFCRENELAHAQTATSFGTRMMNLILLHKVEKKRSKTGFVYVRC
jgi:hypothetical protein